MQIDKLYSSDLYDETYGNCKYFNQKPWDVAMTKKLAQEFNFFEKKFKQDVVNGRRDGNEYYVLLKFVLDGPLIYFGSD